MGDAVEDVIIPTSWIPPVHASHGEGGRNPLFFVFLKGLPLSTNSRKRSIPPCKYQACQTDMEVDTNPILQASPPPPRYRCKCIETHRMCSRVAAGALPMPCKCIATGSKCFQSGRTSCQHGPGQALCSGLPCLVQCRGGQGGRNPHVRHCHASHHNLCKACCRCGAAHPLILDRMCASMLSAHRHTHKHAKFLLISQPGLGNIYSLVISFSQKPYIHPQFHNLHEKV